MLQLILQHKNILKKWKQNNLKPTSCAARALQK
jgi:hypothetical protein